MPSLDLDVNGIEIFFKGLFKGFVPAELVKSVDNAYKDIADMKDRINIIPALQKQ